MKAKKVQIQKNKKTTCKQSDEKSQAKNLLPSVKGVRLQLRECCKKNLLLSVRLSYLAAVLASGICK